MHNYTHFKKELLMRIGNSKFGLLLLLLLLVSVVGFAQVPANDEPCTAIVLTPAAACNFQTFSNVDASNSTAPGVPLPTCGAFVDADVWFRVVVPVSATSITISTLSGPGAAPPQTAVRTGRGSLP